MNNKIAIAAVLALVIIIGVVVLMTSTNNTKTNTRNVDTSRSEPEINTTEEPSQEANEVTYKGFAVSPKAMTVKKGTTVTWTNQDDAMHDVTPEKETDNFKASELFGKGETYKVTFNSVGTYNYNCSPHPYMKGTIEVVE